MGTIFLFLFPVPAEAETRSLFGLSRIDGAHWYCWELWEICRAGELQTPWGALRPLYHHGKVHRQRALYGRRSTCSSRSERALEAWLLIDDEDVSGVRLKDGCSGHGIISATVSYCRTAPLLLLLRLECDDLLTLPNLFFSLRHFPFVIVAMLCSPLHHQ